MKWAGVVLLIAALALFLFGRSYPAFQQDVIYGRGGGEDLKLDLATPANGIGPFPAVVCIHGGAWRSGDKSWYKDKIIEFAAHGYVAVSINYRLAPQHKFPAQVEDAKCAVRYLRAHAKELNLDPSRIAAVGDSAGGHLALMLGFMEPADGLEGSGGYSNQPSKVQAVVNHYGPSDLAANDNWGSGQKVQANYFLNTDDPKDPVVGRASPITYIDKSDASVLTFHGTVDPIVPVAQAHRLHVALKNANVRERLELIEGAGHGWNEDQRKRIDQITYEFLDAIFKR